MATHNLEHCIEGPFEHEEPISGAMEFYQVNNYAPTAPKQLIQTPFEELDMARGVPKSGWYASDMSQLHTQVKILWRDEQLHVHYSVDISGQKLTSADRAFWDKEVEALKRMLCQGDDPEDVSIQETKRAKERRESSISTGLRWGIGLAITIFVIAFIAKIFLVPAQ